MAAPLEVLLTSESSGQLWNTCVWDPESGISLVTYKGGNMAPRTLSVLGQDYLLGAVYNKPLIHVWALGSKDQMQMRMVCPGQVSSLATSPDGQFCVAAVAEKIHVWQVCTGKLLAVLSRHYQTVNCLKFTDDGSHFISGGEDNLVIVWSMASILGGSQESVGVEPRYIWSSHSLPITDIHIGFGGMRARVLTASLDQTCKLWELVSGKMLCSFVFDAAVVSATMDNAECRLFAGATNGHIYQVNLYEKPVQTERHISGSPGSPHIFTGHGKQVTCLTVSMDGTLLASGSHDTNVKLWDICSRQCIRTIAHKGVITNVHLMTPPASLLGGDIRPTVPIQPFKRQLHVPGSGAAAVDRDEGDRPTDTVRIRLGRKVAKVDLSSTLLDTCVEHLQEQGADQALPEEIQAGLQQEISSLKTINKQIYEFTVKQIVNGTNKVP